MSISVSVTLNTAPWRHAESLSSMAGMSSLRTAMEFDGRLRDGHDVGDAHAGGVDAGRMRIVGELEKGEGDELLLRRHRAPRPRAVRPRRQRVREGHAQHAGAAPAQPPVRRRHRRRGVRGAVLGGAGGGHLIEDGGHGSGEPGQAQRQARKRAGAPPGRAMSGTFSFFASARCMRPAFANSPGAPRGTSR